MKYGRPVRAGAVTTSNHPIATCAIKMPAIAPATASRSASERKGAMTLSRLPPSAIRTAASFVRVAARAKRRLATFAQAISRTLSTATIIAPKRASISLLVVAREGVKSRIPTPSFDSGYSRESSAAMEAISSSAR